jgi:hypothetical protein
MNYQMLLLEIMVVFWDVEPFNLVDIDRRFRGASAFIIRAAPANI